jgi:uncharacterized protein involved in exopolysaccharide biosynthesis
VDTSGSEGAGASNVWCSPQPNRGTQVAETVAVMEFYRIWRILVGHRRVLIWLPIVATCVGLGLAFVLPEQYVSTALVLVRPAEELKFNPNADNKEILDYPVGRSAPIDAPSKTYMEVIKSPAVAVKIVEALHLDVKVSKEGQTRFEAFKDELKDWIGATTRTLRNYAKYGRDIPTSAFDLAVENVEDKLGVSVRKDTYAFDISFRSSDPKKAAAVANMAAQIFIEHSSEAYRSEAARAREFIEKQLDESRKALDQARAAVLSFKNSGATFDLTSEFKENLQYLEDLQDTLAKAGGKLAGMRRSFKQDSPEVLAQEAENAALQQQISTLQAQLVAYPEKEARLSAMALTQRLAEESYEFFRRRYEEARVKESAVVTEIRIVSPAEPALYPVNPIKFLYGGLSFAMAAIAAIGWALLAEKLSPRVRSLRDLEDEIGAPLLDAIPSLEAKLAKTQTGRALHVRDPV